MVDSDANYSLEETSSQNSEVAGLIVRITLKNFMCHDHLIVDFNKHINFICGKNGSGKSAILTGLVIGLGGKSCDTNRGSNLKTFIKSGRSQAIIEITLTNVGPKAFKPEIYGDEITVIRIINESSSLYKISKGQGKPVSFKKTELVDMLNCFKIQINNPISILNQDMAKSLIKTSNPKDLYKFFINGTLLNEVEESIKESKDIKLPLLQKTLREKRDELNFINKDLAEIKQKYEKKQQLIELETEYGNLKNEYNWAQVYAARAERKNLEKRLNEVEVNIKDLEKKILNKDGCEKELLEKKEKFTVKLEELNQKKDENNVKIMDAERNYNNALNCYKDCRSKKKTLEKELSSLNTGYEQTKERLRQLDNENAEAAAKRHKRDERREALQTNINDLKTLMNTNNNHIRNLTVSLQKKSDEANIFENACHQIRANIVKSRSRLNELKSNFSELTCYGDYVPRLVDEINSAYSKGNFGKKPIGPLGHYIKLNKMAQYNDISFGPTIESIIGKGLLCGFAVDSNKDFIVLKEIFNKLRIQQTPLVVISEFSDQIYDVRRNKVSHPQYPCMFDALDFNHPVVANSIIDQVSIESILLLPSNEEAYSLMEHIENVPKNCIRSATPNTLFYPAPDYRSYHSNVKKNTTMLQVNKESLIRTTEESLKEQELKEKEMVTKLKLVKDEETSIRTSLRGAEKENDRINKKIDSSEMELFQLSNEEDNISAEQEDLKEDIAYRSKAIDDVKKKIENMNGSIEKFKNNYEEAKKIKDSISHDNYNEEIKSIQDSLDEIDADYREFTANFEKFKRLKNDQNIMLEKIQSSISKVETNLLSLEEAAKAGGQLLDEQSCRPINNLKDRLSEVKNEIKVIKEFIGKDSIEDITTDLQSQILKVECVQNIITETVGESKEMGKNIKKIIAEFESLRLDKSKKIKANFKNITKLRNYKEELTFEHATRKLSILVKTDAKSQNTTSVLSLSGGERSYAMVAFILSLWQEMALPFYFLDEFDVFMDSVNRNLIIKLLIMHAGINSNQQFVFFTPNDFKIDVTSNVGIFRMIDPRDDTFSQL